jgi:hypothetical protein
MMDLDFDDETFVWPQLNIEPALIVVEGVFIPLFTSAFWVVEMRVGQTVVAKSSESNVRHTPIFIKVWTRSIIRDASYTVKLRALNVDVKAEYVRFGGDPSDVVDI